MRRRVFTAGRSMGASCVGVRSRLRFTAPVPSLVPGAPWPLRYFEATPSPEARPSGGGSSTGYCGTSACGGATGTTGAVWGVARAVRVVVGGGAGRVAAGVVAGAAAAVGGAGA